MLNKNFLKVQPSIGDLFNYFCYIHLWSSTWGLFMQTIPNFANIHSVETKISYLTSAPEQKLT